MEQILGPLMQRAADQLGGPTALHRSLSAVLERAARRALGSDASVEVDLSGHISVMVFRRVVEGPRSPSEIDLLDARGIDADVELGDELGCVVQLDRLAPHLRGALVVPAEQYAPLEGLLSDLMWDHDVLAGVPRRAAEPKEAISRLVARLRNGPFAEHLRPGCDPVELEAHEKMLGGALPHRYCELLRGVGGFESSEDIPGLSLVSQGYRLLSPATSQREHAEWTRWRDQAHNGPVDPEGGPQVISRWSTDWLPLAVGSRGAEDTSLLVIDPRARLADRPGELVILSTEEPGWWVLGVDLAGLAHVWHTLALHDLLQFQVPGQGDPIMAAKAESMARHLLPDLRWVEAS